MRRAVYLFAVLVALTMSPVATFAGAPTTRIVVNGPGLPVEGVKINGEWPGWLSFVDFHSGAVPKPPSDLPRYVLTGLLPEGRAGYTSEWRTYYRVLYVWDRYSGRALVYLPGPGDTGYKANYSGGSMYADWAGKCYTVLDQGWADMIRRALPQAVQ